MSVRIGLALALGFAIGCGAPAEPAIGEQTAPVVYGIDDRLEVYNHPNPELRLIAERSIVALIPSFRLSREPDGTYGLVAQSLGEAQQLCEDELFGNQPVAAMCSGVLIDDDLVLTAGHCVDAATPCTSYLYVFNFHLTDADRLASIRDEDVYTCQRVVIQERNGFAFTPDFAIVQLDRPVEGAKSSATVRPATELDEGDALTMIGFPSGLPAKIDSGGAVADPRAEDDFFVANVDAFHGHSGGATFDSENRLAGILVAGNTPDYVRNEGESCYRVSVYDDAQAGEVIHDVAPIVDALCSLEFSSGNLCDPEGCEGSPCGRPSKSPPASSGGGVVPGSNHGCSLARESSLWQHAPWIIVLWWAGRRRLRRPSARPPRAPL